jgi:hypothetical protein
VYQQASNGRTFGQILSWLLETVRLRSALNWP